MPKRLTTESGDEFPLAFSDKDHVLFKAELMPTLQSVIFDSNSFPQIYQVATVGTRPKLFSEITMEDLDINKNGDILYHDKKGYEDEFRKHHRSPITRDIWLCRNGKFTKLTTFDGEDRTPRWSADGSSYYYLSEEDGTFNIYRRNIDGSNKTQLTHYKGNPVRFLTIAKNGTLCYGYDGEIYTLTEGSEPQKVAINVITDQTDKDLVRQVLTTGASEIKLSPNGKEIAFVLHGDVYVTSIDYKTTKQITGTPEQERDIDISPDGRSIVYASERGGLWQIYMATPKQKKEKELTYATDIEEQRLTNSEVTSQMPDFSPDGKSVAFLENRGTLRAIDLKTKVVRTLMDGKYMFSYSDGDVWFEWSPDSRRLISSYIGTGGWNSQDIVLVNASGNGDIRNLTESGYNSGRGKWVLGGKAMIFQSDRAGYRSHGSWGSEDDVYIMFFDLDAYDRFRMTKEEVKLADAKDKEVKDEAAKNKDVQKKSSKKKNEKKEKDAKEEVKPLQLDVENCRDRVIRLTVNSSRLGDAVLSNTGDTLY